MKKDENKTSKFVCILLLLCIIAMILVAGTYAKYTSSASGTATATVAKWDIKLNGKTLGAENATVDFDLFGDDKLVYPGKTGSFDFVIKNDSEVAAEYGIVFDVTGATLPLEYSLDGGANWGKDLNSSATKTLAVGSNAETVTVLWRWADKAENNATDTAIGIESAETENGLEVNVKATLVVNQAQ